MFYLTERIAKNAYSKTKRLKIEEPSLGLLYVNKKYLIK